MVTLLFGDSNLHQVVAVSVWFYLLPTTSCRAGSCRENVQVREQQTGHSDQLSETVSFCLTFKACFITGHMFTLQVPEMSCRWLFISWPEWSASKLANFIRHHMDISGPIKERDCLNETHQIGSTNKKSNIRKIKRHVRGIPKHCICCSSHCTWECMNYVKNNVNLNWHKCKMAT